MIKDYKHKETFRLENGQVLNELTISYQTFGKRNLDDSNIVWVFHALSANANVMSWWPGLFGEEELFNPKDHFIICASVIGSPYGKTVPKNLDFPIFTVRDVVNAHLKLANELNITKIGITIGGSFGGHQAMEFAYSFTGKISNLILLACSPQESAYSIAIHQAQRMALKADHSFGTDNGGENGLKAARGIGLLTYRTFDAYIDTQTDNDDIIDNFKASSYIQYQGDKFEKRFTAISYYYLTKCLDTHNIGRSRGGYEKALSEIQIPTLVIALDSDQLIPPILQKKLANHIPNAIYKEINSKYGHDGFLIETKKITSVITSFLAYKTRK